jgi:hypothetical protein
VLHSNSGESRASPGRQLLSSFDTGSMTNNFGYPPVYTADFGGNIDVFISMEAPGAGGFDFTVTGTQEPYSASASTNLDEAGQFYQ